MIFHHVVDGGVPFGNLPLPENIEAMVIHAPWET